MGGGDFTPVLEIVVFCVCLFIAGVLCKRVRMRPAPYHNPFSPKL